jgi:hypothetical protein
MAVVVFGLQAGETANERAGDFAEFSLLTGEFSQ